MAGGVELGVAVETLGLHDQRVAVPAARGHPFQLSGMSAGHLKPALVGTQWNQVFCSNSNASASVFWTICRPCGELMLRDMPNGRQLPA